MQKKYHTAEYLRTIPHLRLRSPFNALLARLRSDCEYYIATFYRENDFVRVAAPIITSSDCEGAGEVFTLQPKDPYEERIEFEQNETSEIRETVESPAPSGTEDYFRSPKYLTVSAQLHLEAFIHEHQRVWTLSPTFRAERSDTPRHLSEFHMLEVELRTSSLATVMDMVESMIREVATKTQASPVGQELLAVKRQTEAPGHARPKPNPSPNILASNPSSEPLSSDNPHPFATTSSAALLLDRWAGLKRAHWPRITYTRAMQLLRSAAANGSATFTHPPAWATGLQLEHEKYLAAEVGRGGPVFVTDYPAHLKAFYMLPSAVAADPDAATDVAADAPTADPDATGSATVACFDLLMPEVCEVAGGSLREHGLARLERSMAPPGKPVLDSQLGPLEWYVDLRRFGSVPHGGFGLGFERLLAYLAGVESVRDVAAWPRYYGRCDG
jgi:asparaginyl-tRNA synthetase